MLDKCTCTDDDTEGGANESTGGCRSRKQPRRGRISAISGKCSRPKKVWVARGRGVGNRIGSKYRGFEFLRMRMKPGSLIA